MTSTTTLAELATTHPAASRVFRRRGLDFCCGGRRPLADVCETRGLDADAILGEIAAEEAAVDLPRWDQRPLPELVAFIVDRYHRSLRAELPELVALAARVESRHGDKPTAPRGLRAHLALMEQAVASHLEKEEQVLFPMLLAGAAGLAASPIRVIEEEHDDHGRNLARVRELTADLTPPPEACPTWRALYLRLGALEAELMDHIHLENNVLFPRALGEMEAGQ
ncbi:MAG: iron-sulfur cluster repair di-iron protein [Vicinamibacterales bacterium]